ncbi:FAD-dependent oxidoreductase [Corynebacterium stationis]|uniref:FAD-dependent oxidoreductase n=1 Tax=Corynebacterium stationis TaxID=1705 RepID=UPI000AFF75D6|nr:FAD-dependent oxidoreductase [Corynebacterium stationis]HJG65187.1 FAD-dependent oxidoreductase [Corynebacterium stationis]
MANSSNSSTSLAPSESFDVVIVGSGAGGLSAAVTAAYHGLSVCVVEKSEVLGGATSWSGGWAWTPGTHFAKQDGVVESKEEFQTYLHSVLGERYDIEAKNIDAFLEAAPHMVEFFAKKTSLDFTPGAKIRDIYGQLPSAGTGHRSVGPKPFDLKEVKLSLRKKLRHQLYETSFFGMGIMAGEDLTKFLSASQLDPRGWIHAARRVITHIFDLLFYGRTMHLVNGTALTARLAKSADDLGVELRTNTTALELIKSDSRISGVKVQGEQGSYILEATKGVVLATGGFPNNVERRRELFPKTPTGQEHFTLAPETTTGDGLRMAREAGAHFVDDNHSAAAWCPVSLVPYFNGKTGVFPHIMDRAKPGSIGVTKDGKRFVNEANGYFDYVDGMIKATKDGDPVASWQIADASFVRKYPLGMAKPFPMPLFPYLASGYLKKGKTIEELARKCGIDPEGLKATVEEFNANARAGKDPEFGRGETEFNRYGGDPKVGPNPSLGPIEKGPFYAVKVHPGSFGTFAGIAADENGAVLDKEGEAIEGLFTAGNDRNSIMGGFYPAGGVNLGPALGFGYIIGRTLAGAKDYEVSGQESTL